MNTHSLFGYLFIALFSLLVVSCYSTPDGVMSSLSQAEKIMESRPDSAMAILQHIPTPETLHGKAQADYSLLMTQAMDKNYINFTSDSLIKFAVGYYGGHTEDLVAKGKSFYYYGRVMESLDKVEDAMTFYLKAKDVLENSQEYKLLGLMSEGLGNLNRKQKLFDAALINFRTSLQFYSKMPDSLGISFAYRNIGRVFLYNEQLDSAYYYFDKALHIADIKKYMTLQTIGHDKINQLRHVKFLKDADGIKAHMKKQADIIRPKFEAVLEVLDKELGGLGIATWTKPNGGYFISFETLDGCAKAVVGKCKEAGVVMTGAGATFPYGKDPKDSNIRIAPSFPTPEDLGKAAEVFVLCVKLTSVEKLLATVR